MNLLGRRYLQVLAGSGRGEGRPLWIAYVSFAFSVAFSFSFRHA
jgi:hypothetical protein